MEFKPLRILITDLEIQTLIDNLLNRKKDADEKTLIAPIAAVNNWLAPTLDYCKDHVSALPAVRKDTLELDVFFRKYLQPWLSNN